MAKRRIHARLERQQVSESTWPEQQSATVRENGQDSLTPAGQKLDSEASVFLEPRFGHAFSQVHITDEYPGTKKYMLDPEHVQPVARSVDTSTTETVMGPEGGQLSSGLSASIQAERGQGRSLDAPVREQMEQAFGANFADVRLHTDSASQVLNHSVGAQAFTVGSDIFFGPQTAPDDTQLLAHELTHVVQQRGMNNAGPLVVGPASDSYEQEADAASRAIAANASPVVGSATGQASQAQRLSENAPFGTQAHTIAEHGSGVLIQRKPRSKMEQRMEQMEQHMEEMEQRMEQMEQNEEDVKRHEDAQNIRVKAIELDQMWMPRFEERFSGYREAIERISTGMQAASKGFQEAQSKQAEFEAAVMGALGAMLTLAGGFEFAFAPGLGKLAGTSGKTAEEIKKLTKEEIKGMEEAGEHAVSAAHSVVDVGLDRAKEGAKPAETPKSESIPGAQAPAGAAGGDPLAFLTSNLAAIDHQWQSIAQAFAVRSALTRDLSDDQWLNFDVGAQEKIYQQLYDDFLKVASPASELASDDIIALVLERHMWASWIKETAEQASKAEKMYQHFGGMEFGDAESNEDNKNTDYSWFSPGSEIESRLNELNINILAGVELTGHWYSSNSPDNWQELLVKWAHEYAQGIGK
jgi:hypothetical protein